MENKPCQCQLRPPKETRKTKQKLNLFGVPLKISSFSLANNKTANQI
jgi:hypothetical protein